MTRIPHALAIVLVLLLAACTRTGETSPSVEPTDTPQPTPSATPEASASPEPTDSAEPSASSSPIEGGSGFTIEANAEADAHFLERFSCENLDDGYRVDFPAEWNTNAELGGVPPCSWFAPTEYQTGGPGEVPDEVAIEIFIIDGDRGYHGEISERQEGMVGATQPATRIEVTDGDVTAYEYVVQLGRTLEEGPNLVARTSTEMGGDFDLNRAILDRMVATMEFIGVIQ
jgi:hypothetical protein